MKFLVDTNIYSEITSHQPDENVAQWVKANEAYLYTTTITLGELKYGINRLDEGRRKESLQSWLTELSRRMDGRILGFNRRAALVWADLRSQLASEGITLSLADSMIAAIAKRNGMVVATRNIKDFKPSGVKTVNPFLY